MRPHPQPKWGAGENESEAGPRARLTKHEHTRLLQAASDLSEARRADLTLLDAAGLIRMVERLRGSLDDMVQLLRDLES